MHLPFLTFYFRDPLCEPRQLRPRLLLELPQVRLGGQAQLPRLQASLLGEPASQAGPLQLENPLFK